VSVRRTSVDLGGVAAECSVPAEAASDALPDATVLYLHGGAFMFCGIATHRRLCGRLALTLGVPVYSLRYRQLPDVGAGTSLHDAYSAYQKLLEMCPDPGKVIVAGDSVGGYLAAKICELAARDQISPPAAFIGYSPLLNLDVDHRDPALLRHDAFTPISTFVKVKQKWLRGPVPWPGARSPIDAALQVFPPTFLTAAERELFDPDVREFTTRLAESGQLVETHIWRRQVHAFPVLGGLLPESREVIRLTGAFLRPVLAL
jgi:acetyl esterase/lipase